MRNRKPAVASKSMNPAINDAGTDTWEAYRKALLRFVLLRVSEQAAAEDIVQEVLLKAYTRRATLKEPSSLRGWLYQITRNKIIDYYRSRKPALAVPEEHNQEDARSEDARAETELARCLEPLLEEVPEPYRRALKLADLEGVRQQEIASRLRISLSGAKSRVQRARSMLRDVLLKCCRVELDRRGRAIDYEPLRECRCAPSSEPGH